MTTSNLRSEMHVALVRTKLCVFMITKRTRNLQPDEHIATAQHQRDLGPSTKLAQSSITHQTQK